MAGSDLQFYLTWLKDQLKAQVIKHFPTLIFEMCVFEVFNKKF